MKRKSSPYRRIVFPSPVVGPIADRQPNLARGFFVNGQRNLRARKIFLIEQTTCARKKIRRVLILDNHPDSLRLVLGGGANPHDDLSEPHRVSSWDLIIVSTLTVGVLVGMFWPLL